MILEEYELEDMSEPGNREWYQLFAETLFKSQGSDKKGSCAVSQYPNLLPEVLSYAFGLSALAKEASSGRLRAGPGGSGCVWKTGASAHRC